MALEKQNISISLGKGIDTKTDPKQVVVGKLLTLQNCTFQSTERFKKRNGYGVLNASLSAGNAITAYNNELVAFDGSSVYSYGAQLQDITLKGKKVACDIAVDSIVRNSNQQTSPDSCILNGIMCFAYLDSSGVTMYTLLDQVTKKVYVTGVQVGTLATSAKVNSVGNYFIVSYVENLTFLKCLTINSSTFATTTITISSLGTSNQYYDVATSNSKLVYAYTNASNTTSIVSLNASLSLGTPLVYGTLTLQKSVFDNGSGAPYVGFNSGSSLQYIACNSALTSYTGPVTVETISNIQNVTGIYNPVSPSAGPLFFYEILNTTGLLSDNFVRTCQVVGSTPGTASDLLRSVGLWSKPYSYGGNFYLCVAHQSTLQSCYFVIDQTGSVISRIATENGGGLSTNGVLREVNFITSNEIQFAYLIKDFVTSVNGNVYTQTGINSLNLSYGGPIETQVVGNNVNISGGVVSVYDSSSVIEKNFHLYPENITATTAPTGGGLATGEYQYVGINEWTDNKGQVHQSATSVPITVDTSLNSFFATGYGGGSTLNPSSGFGWNYCSPGCLVTGSGVPSNTYLAPGGAISTNQATTSGSGTEFTFTPGKALQITCTQGSSIATLDQLLGGTVYGSSISGSNVITMNADCDVPIGSSIYAIDPNSGSEISSVVTQKNGLLLTLNSNFPQTFTNIIFHFLGYILGNTTNGSATAIITSGVAPSVGRSVSLSNPSRTATVVSVSGTSVTFSSSFNYTSSSGYIFGNTLVNQNPPAVGEQFINVSSIGSSVFTGTVTVTASSAGSITLNQQASASSTSSMLVSQFSQSANLTIPTLRVTNKSNVSLALYRTLVNQSVFYRVTSFTSPLINDKTKDFLTFSDTVPDSILLGNEELYTTGSVVDNFPPPPSSVFWTYKNRSMIVPSELPTTIWYSKPVIPGTTAEFSDQFVTNVPDDGGAVTAGAELDAKNIIFKNSSIFVQVGDGPNNTGGQNDFTDPQKLPTDVGCTNSKSLILIPSGLMFQSAKGFYLLDRSLNVEYTGKDVEAYNNYAVTSAELISNQNQVRFSLAGSPLTLVYDYQQGQWGTYSNPEVKDATIYNNLYTYIAPNGEIYQETPGTFLDGTASILMGLTTSWLSFAGLQGFQRVRRLLLLGEYKSPHSLVIQVAYNFLNSYTQSVTIPVTSAPSGAYQYRVHLENQKCEAIQITLSEQQSTPYGEGLSLSAFAFEVGAKKGLNKLPDAQSYG